MSKLQSFKKALTKQGVSLGFSEISEWLSLPTLSMNHAVTGNFFKAIPNRRTLAIAGQSGAGKSLIIAHLMKEAQEKGYIPVVIDTEGALDKEFLDRVGVDTSEDAFVPISVSTIEELTGVMSNAFIEFDKDEKLAFFVDSATALITEQELEAFDKKGQLANSFGLFQKKLKQLILTVNNKMLDRDWFFVYSLHVFENQDPLNGQGKYMISGGRAQLFVPSICLMLTRLKLKDGTEQVGIKMNMEVMKTRYFKTGTKITAELPWETGFDKYDGLAEILEEHGVLKRSGAWYSYNDPDTGDEVKFQKKNITDHVEKLLPVLNSEEIKEVEE